MSNDIYVKIQSTLPPFSDENGDQIFRISLDAVSISRDGKSWKPVTIPTKTKQKSKRKAEKFTY